MKKIILSLSLLFSLIGSSLACTDSSCLEDIYIREHWVSITKSYDIETKTQKLGSLYRRLFSFPLTYDFYDYSGRKELSAQARFFSFTAHLDIVDNNDKLVGSVQESLFTFFPTFMLYAEDQTTKLARAEMNFWGTAFYVYDPETNQEMALMTRPFLRFKNDWTITVTNNELLKQKNIRPSLLITVLAVQGEIEEWQKRQRENDKSKSIQTAEKTKQPFQQLISLAHQESVTKEANLNPAELEAAAKELDRDFNTAHPSAAEQTNAERLQTFTAFCKDRINSPDLSAEKKNLVMTLLNLRLQGHQ